MRVLLTGAAGQVGSALLRSVPSHIELRALAHQQLDSGGTISGGSSGGS